MAELRAAEAARRDRTVGVDDRQYQWLKPRIPAMVKQLAEGQSFVIAGMFDTEGRKNRYNAVWVLSASDKEQIYAVAPGGTPTGGTRFPVGADGELFRKPYAIVNGEREYLHTPYWLNRWLIPKEFSGEFIQIVNEMDGSTTSIPFNRSEIVHDSSLPRVTLR